MAAETPTAATESVGLQAQLDQLEAAILEAHRFVDRSAPRDGDSDSANAPGAEATAARCIEEMKRLNERLEELGLRTGVI